MVKKNKNLLTKEVMKDMDKIKIHMEKEGLEYELNLYIRALARYCFEEVTITGDSYEESWKESWSKSYELINNAKISDKEKQRLRKEISLFSSDGFFKSKPNDFLKNKIAICKNKLNVLGFDKKVEIIKDCIDQKAIYFKFAIMNSKLIEEIEKIKKKEPENNGKK